MPKVVLWQGIVSPHMSGLACALAAQGVSVTFIAGESISAHREQQGWSAPALPGVSLKLVTDTTRVSTLAASFADNAIHLTQGVRRNGYVSRAVSVLRRSRARWGAVLETVDDRGLMGVIKRLDYAIALRKVRKRPDFVLAIGINTSDWVIKRSFPRERVFPFTYFLDAMPDLPPHAYQEGPFRVGFVGQLVYRKRLDLLIQALGGLRTRKFQLVVIGAGPMEATLRQMADSLLGKDSVQWLERLPMMAARSKIAGLDCLVLPSDQDGWGVVVSEALMGGVPAICSDACGAALAVRASGKGGVFPSGEVAALRSLLEQVIEAGPVDIKGRTSLARWAQCLSSDAGARYFNAVMAAVYEGQVRPAAPWDSAAVR